MERKHASVRKPCAFAHAPPVACVERLYLVLMPDSCWIKTSAKAKVRLGWGTAAELPRREKQVGSITSAARYSYHYYHNYYKYYQDYSCLQC